MEQIKVNTDFNIEVPAKVQKIIGRLRDAGYEAYAVGGCVRDSLLGREPNDWDITTNASPLQTKALFDHTIDTGIAHGTVTVMMGGEGFEVTTYRIDGAYEDSRHPSGVTFTADLSEDLKRRDFTINAMAVSADGGLVDIFGGVSDMNQRLIRCVGDPMERFSEDALRIMRAVRFSAQLDFPIHPDTAKAARELAPNLAKISAERVQTELVKLLVSDHPERIMDCLDLAITKVVFPEFDRMADTPQNGPHHSEGEDSHEFGLNVAEHTVAALRACPGDKVVRLAVLLHDIGKPDTVVCSEDGIYSFPNHAEAGELLAKKVFRRLKFDRDTMDKACRLIRHHSLYPEMTKAGIRKAIHTIGEDLFPAWLQVKRADVMAQNEASRRVRLPMLDQIEADYEEIKKNGDCLSLKGLALTGRDLIAEGMTPGKQLGAVLEQLLLEVLEDPARNTREYLLSRSRSLKN